MQIVTNASVRSHFQGKIRKIFQNVICWNFYPACKVLNNIQLAQIANYNSRQPFNPSPAFENSVDPDELASEEASWSGSSLFAIKYINFISTIRIKWSDWLKIRSGCGILIYSAWQGLNSFFFNQYHSMNKIRRQQIDDIFSYFPRIQSLTFHAKCLQ